MKSFYLKKLTAVISCAILSALFIVALFFGAPKTPALPQADGRTYDHYVQSEDENGNKFHEKVTKVAGKDFTAVSIAEFGNLKKITKVNYVANKYVLFEDFSMDMQTVDLEKPFEFAKSGTLIFVLFNLDPFSPDFFEQSERLSAYKRSEYWQFTLSLPKIFCASNIYKNTELVARRGELENYDFTKFCNDNVQTDKYSSMTENTFIDLKFYTEQRALNSFIVTVHYQSSGGLYSGIADCPLIGTDKAVKGTYENSKNLLIAVALLAAVVSAVLIVLSVIERKKDFVPAIVCVSGIALLLISRFILTQATGAPLLWVAFWLASSFVILGGTLFSVGRNFGKVPAKYIFPALSAVGALFAFICPFISFKAASGMQIACIVIKGVCAAALSGFVGISLIDKNDRHGILGTCCAGIVAVAIISSLFMPQVFPTQINPLFWLCAAVTAITFVSVFIVFTEMKKSNVYLTENLHKEVERQVKDIKAVIAERDKLLQFVSHDMKKTPAIRRFAVRHRHRKGKGRGTD